MRTQAKCLGLVSLLVMATAEAGCQRKVVPPSPPPTQRQFRLTHHVGGTHTRVLVQDGRCLMAFGVSVQVIDPQSLQVISDVPLGPFGQCGPVIDLAISGERLYAVIEDDAVVEMDLQPGTPPRARRTNSSDELGVLPRRLSVVEGDVYVSGIGGVTNLATGQRVFESAEECGSVAQVGDDMVVCVGRRVLRIPDGRYLGAATQLVGIPGASADGGVLAFALQGESSALAGLMNEEIREIPSGKATVAMPERVERLRVLGDRLVLVGSQRVDWYEWGYDALKLGGSIDILGALDVDQLDHRTLILAGTAGRAIYQIDDDAHALDGGRFIAAEREASRLSLATGDGLNIFAGSREGAWMYLANARAELTKRSIESAPRGAQQASAVDGTATITSDGRTLLVTPAPGAATSRPWEYREPKGARLHTVIAVDGSFWLGHDRGITVLRADGGVSAVDPRVLKESQRDPNFVLPLPDPVLDRLRIPGPVLYLFPLLAGKGATYVSEFGGFGVARFMDEPLVTTAPAQK